MGLTEQRSYYGRLSDSFMADNNTFFFTGVDVRIRLYRSPDQFVLLLTEGTEDSQGKYAIQILNASLIAHKLEPKNETFLGLERAHTRKAAQYNFREVVAKSILIAKGVTLYYKSSY